MSRSSVSSCSFALGARVRVPGFLDLGGIIVSRTEYVDRQPVYGVEYVGPSGHGRGDFTESQLRIASAVTEALSLALTLAEPTRARPA